MCAGKRRVFYQTGHRPVSANRHPLSVVFLVSRTAEDAKRGRVFLIDILLLRKYTVFVRIIGIGHRVGLPSCARLW